MMMKLCSKGRYLDKSLKLTLCFLFFCIIQVNLSRAQDTLGLHGKIVDSISMKPIKYATIILSSESKNIKTSLTDESGIFKFDKITAGVYFVSVSNFNYVKTIKEVNISESVQDIGDILIGVKNNDLKEVSIVAQNIITRSIDRLKYNVEKDPQSNVASVLNMIEKVPLLSVDPNGVIKFQGESNYRILIDNKPSMLLVHNASEVLKNMPASTIKSIEVITSPSGKYLVDGIAGVINILTKKRIENGYEGTANVQYKTPAGGIGAGLTQVFKQGKLGVSAYLSYSDSHVPFTETELSRTVNGTTNSLLQQNGEVRNVLRSKIISTDISYDIDSLKLLTAHFARYTQKNRLYSNFETVVSDLDHKILQRYYTENQNQNSLEDLEFSLDYQKQFVKNKDKILTISYLFTRSNVDLDIFNSFNEKVNFANSNYGQTNSFVQNEHSFQVDLVHPVKKIKINTGFKGVARLGNNKSDMLIYDNSQDISDIGVNDYVNNQYLLFAYNSYQIAFKRWEILGGYRFEFANSKSIFKNTLSPLRNTYVYFIPNLTLNYQISNAESLNLSFNQSVQRPNISYLNPFIDKSNLSLEVTGNPDLSPVKRSRLNLQYSSLAKSSLILSLSYSFTNNDIQQVYTNTDTIGVSRLTYDNVSRKNNLSFNASYNFTLNKDVSFNASGNLLYTTLKGVSNSNIVSNSGVIGDMNFGVNYILGETLQVNGRFSYTSPAIYLQGKNSSYPVLMLGGTKQLLKKRLSLGFSVVNPLSRYQYINNSFSGLDFQQQTRSQIYNRSFLIKAALRFGQMKGRIRTNNKGINNDDAIKKR